jgi:hypothetical protein
MEKNIKVHEIEPNEFIRPDVLEGYTPRLKTPCGSLFVNFNHCDNKLREIQATLGKSGSCQNLLFRTISLLMSVLLQANISRENIVKAISHQMEGSCGNGRIYCDGIEYLSCIDFILKMTIEDMANRGEIKIEQETT